jgi:hypothetical protein
LGKKDGEGGGAHSLLFVAFGELDGDLGPHGYAVPVPPGRIVLKEQRSTNRGRIKCRISAGFEYFHAIHSTFFRYPYSKKRLALDVGVPEVQGVLDGNVTVERGGVFDLAAATTQHQGEKAKASRHMCHETRQPVA